MTYLVKFNDGTPLLEIKDVVAVEMYGVSQTIQFYTKNDGIKVFEISKVFTFCVDSKVRLPR